MGSRCSKRLAISLKIYVKVLWDLWDFGNFETGIRPYLQLEKILPFDKDRNPYCKAKNVIGH